MSYLRIAQTTQITLTQTFYVDGVPTDASGAVTVTTKRLDGTMVHTTTATDAPGTGVYTYVLPAAQTALLDILTVDWSGSIAGATVVLRDLVEVVGGFWFSDAELRQEVKALADPNLYPPSKIAKKRIYVEQEAEYISGQAWVPRFARFVLDGSGSDELVVPDGYLRTVRSAKVAPVYGGTFTALDPATIAPTDSGILVAPDVWPDGRRNVIVEYEHGHDYPREDLRLAAMMRMPTVIGQPNSAIPARAVTFTVTDGGTYRLTTSGPRSTGIPDIDAAYLRGTFERFWIAS